MLVRVYPSGILKNKEKDNKNEENMYVVTSREIFIHTSRVFIDGEEIELGENDELLLEVDALRIIDEHFDSERDILTCKEVKLFTRGFSMKEAIRDGLDEAQYIVTWVTRPPE